ncbi:MAG: PQQ-like beta-propeller repeat protein, partial [Deltaproteobacteria bacterium]|nr:PQQ-like beta-propeller repeat protein [Deltaproteobacteria bacterium]
MGRRGCAGLAAAVLAVGCGAVRDTPHIELRTEPPRAAMPARGVHFGAPSAGRRLAALATRWSAPLVWHPEAGRTAGVTADHVVLETGDGLTVHELSTGASRRYEGVPGVVTAVHDTIVTLPILAPSAGLDPRDGRLRWSHAARMQPSIEGVPLAVSSAGTLVIAGGGLPTVGTTRHPGPVVALDAATGTLRWRATEVDARALHADGDRVYVAGFDGVAARDTQTARVLWRWSPAWSGREDCFVVRPLVVSGEALVTARECGRIVVLDRTTGALRGDLDVDGELNALDVAGHVSFAALVPRGVRGPGRGVLRAIDLATGRTRWEKPVSALGARTLVRAADGAVLLVTDDGTITAFDRASGSAFARYRIPEIVDASFARPAHLDRWLLLARTRAGSLVAVEPRDVVPPNVSVHIRGRVTLRDETARGTDGPLAGGRVFVDGSPIALDADGRFEHVVTTRGAIRIRVDPRDVAAASAGRPMGCFEHQPAWIVAER